MNFCLAASKASAESARSIPMYDSCSENVSANSCTCARKAITVHTCHSSLSTAWWVEGVLDNSASTLNLTAGSSGYSRVPADGNFLSR